jgi:sodium/proline symporter
MDIALISAFLIYLFVLLIIGLLFYHKSKNADEFMVGNRSVNYWVTAIATQASDMGSWLFLAYPGALYTSGLIEAWTAIGLVVFMFLNWQFIAPKLRSMTEELETPTFSSFFNKRFHDKTGNIAVLSACILLLFFTFYISSGLVGMGRLFESAFNLDYHIGILLALGAALLYTLIGGFVAVAWCNLFQGLFLLCMIIMVPAYAYWNLPLGFTSITATAHAKNISLSLLPDSFAALGNILILSLGWGLGYFGQPHILVNFMGIDDVRKVRYAKYVGITWQIMVLSAAIFLGLISIAYFDQGISNPELSFVIITKELFTPLLAGFALCGILAATLSSMDTHILVSASTIAEDLYKRLFKRSATQIELVWASRIGGLLISSVAMIIAFHNSSSVYSLVNYAWSGLGSSFGPLVIASLYWNKVTRKGALAGLITGSIVAAIWPYLGTGILPLIPGFTSNMIALYLVSILDNK